MRVRMKVDISGTRNGKPWPGRGQTLDLPPVEAASLCSSGMAEGVEKATPPKAETATPPEPEAPSTPAAEKRRGRPRLPRDSDGNVIRE